MKQTRPFHILTILLALAAVLVVTGCDTIHSIKPNITNTNGDLGGSIEITFRKVDGVQQSIVIPRNLRTSRGYNTDGVFVSSGTLKGYAIAAYEADQLSGAVAKQYQLNEQDRDTVETVLNRLARAGAKTFNP